MNYGENVTALVTGATGFVGSHVARLLSVRDHKIRVLVRQTSRRENLAGLNPDLTEIVTGDLTNPESLILAISGCETLYHIAADYRLWSKDPEELYRSNVEGTRQLLQVVA